MTDVVFSQGALGQMKSHGLSAEKVLRQIDRFKKPPKYMELKSPCTIGDGIIALDPKQRQVYLNAYESEGKISSGRRLLKFVPASGAASRMFKSLHRFMGTGEIISRQSLVGRADQGEKDARELLLFMDGMRKLAFFDDLKTTLHDRGFDMEKLLETWDYRRIIHFLLSKDGLNYAHLPKGLLKFHLYKEGNRTAFEEHLVEAVFYVADQKGRCAIHFTVSPDHLERFHTLLERVRSFFANKYDASFQVHFSVQKESTDTVAVDLDNRPFLQNDGSILFRPGGHGALIENLNDLKGDIIFIKNIDNVAPDRLKGVTSQWKKTLCGYLLTLQKRIFGYLEKLASGQKDDAFLNGVSAFIKDQLVLSPPSDREGLSRENRRRLLLEQLNRPVRVCGMVKNQGEPGGGPFWVVEGDGRLSRQIVEKAQVDPDNREQRGIFASSTHFNPVDLVCGVRDWQGNPFDLTQFVDDDAVFISQKSKNGKDLKALELPGLWNGAMAYWITLFVEVPASTFTPVKTVNDLLRKEHQPL
jgi:hypothetical protein